MKGVGTDADFHYCVCINIAGDFCFCYLFLQLILHAIYELRPRAVVIDSIQTIYLPEAVGSAGSVVQVLHSTIGQCYLSVM